MFGTLTPGRVGAGSGGTGKRGNWARAAGENASVAPTAQTAAPSLIQALHMQSH
jgi:hypothetical protein